jgi:hypothetical protein
VKRRLGLLAFRRLFGHEPLHFWRFLNHLFGKGHRNPTLLDSRD